MYDIKTINPAHGTTDTTEAIGVIRAVLGVLGEHVEYEHGVNMLGDLSSMVDVPNSYSLTIDAAWTVFRLGYLTRRGGYMNPETWDEGYVERSLKPAAEYEDRILDLDAMTFMKAHEAGKAAFLDLMDEEPYSLYRGTEYDYQRAARGARKAVRDYILAALASEVAA